MQTSFLQDHHCPEVSFNLYHDESGQYKKDRWFFHGILCVPEAKQNEVVSILKNIRQGYSGEIHFKKLRGSNQKVRVSESWLRIYVNNLSNICTFHCLAIDTQSPSFEHTRFKKPHHAYNRFALMAVRGCIAWTMNKYEKVAVRLYSDLKSRSSDDNFEYYLPRQLKEGFEAKRMQRPSELRLLNNKVIQVDSNPQHNQSNESELIQLTDLLTSATAQAVIDRSSKQAKVDLGIMVASWVKDTYQAPWLQDKGLHRRFSVSYFPDQEGNFFKKDLDVLKNIQTGFWD